MEASSLIEQQRQTIKDLVKEAEAVGFATEDSRAPQDIEYLCMNMITAKQIGAVRSICHKLKKLRISGLLKQPKAEEISEIETLQELDIRIPYVINIDSALNSILRLSNLRALSLQNERLDANLIAKVSEKLPLLEEFAISHSKNLSQNGFEMLRKLKHLKSLTLGWIHPVKQSVLASIARNLSHLKGLVFYECSFQNQQVLLNINLFQVLQKLTFSRCWVLSETVRKLLPTLSSSLKSIHLGWIQPLIDFLQRFPNLNSITSEANNEIDNQTLIDLSTGTTSIKELSLGGSTKLTPIGIKCLVKRHHDILCLNLNGFNSIRDVSLILISSELVKLRQLYLQRCELSDRGLNYLRKLRELRRTNLKFNKMTKQTLIKLLANFAHLVQLQCGTDNSTTKEKNKIIHRQLVKEANQVSRGHIEKMIHV